MKTNTKKASDKRTEIFCKDVEKIERSVILGEDILLIHTSHGKSKIPSQDEQTLNEIAERLRNHIRGIK